MARELQTDTPFQQVVEIARRIEGVLVEERESKEAKRSRSSGGFSGFYQNTQTMGPMQLLPHVHSQLGVEDRWVEGA